MKWLTRQLRSFLYTLMVIGMIGAVYLHAWSRQLRPQDEYNYMAPATPDRPNDALPALAAQ